MASPAPVNELSATIAKELRATQGDRLPAEALHAVSAALAAEHLRLEPEQPRVIDPSLTEAGVVYAIHDADLKLMDESTAIAAALWTLMKNPLAVVGKLVALLYRLRRKRYRLEGEEALTLLALREAPGRGWTAAEVRDHLERAFEATLSEERVQTLLSSLKDVRLPDNTRTDFADEHQGRWFPVDV